MVFVALGCGKWGITEKHDAEQVYFKERVVAGGPEQFMEVRHVVIKGSNYAIGKKTAEIAQGVGVRLAPSGDRLRNRVQREYIAGHYPILYDRMRGIADAYGLEIRDDTYDFSVVFQYASNVSGCSVVFFPGAFTESGRGILSRNYDFSTGTLEGRRPRENEVAAMSRPYIFELYPDEGHASLSICAFDLLGGVLDGVNSEGLAVAVLAEEEAMLGYGLDPSQGIGTHELLSMRYLLDNCRDVDEAKEAMLALKHYYSFIPCHYIIADAGGESFVFEFWPSRNSTAIVDGEGPQCVTNHPLSRYESIDQLPQDAQIDSYERYRAMHASIAGRQQFDIEEMKAINSNVAATAMAFDHPDYAPGRTLWHALYDTRERSLSVKFYVGEGPDPTDTAREVIDYTDYLEFRLEDDD
jgi:predicted choloylglycine hydrolase